MGVWGRNAGGHGSVPPPSIEPDEGVDWASLGEFIDETRVAEGDTTAGERMLLTSRARLRQASDSNNPTGFT